jgi:hypothetical protein
MKNKPLCTNIFTSIHQELREIALLLDDINKDYTLPIDEWPRVARKQRKVTSPSNQTVTYQNRRRSSDRIVIEGIH